MKRIPRIISVILICAAVTSVFSGCSVFDVFSVDSLIRAPKVTGEYAAVQAAFENAVGEDISLVTPLVGSYRSSYILYDFDNDGEDDAVVFYTLNSSPEEVHMHLLEGDGSEWISAGDITGSGSEVFEIKFVNLDKDSSLEFAVTWTVSDSKRTKTLSLYKFMKNDESEQELKTLAVLQLTKYLVLDIDSDGANEIFYTYSDFSNDNLCFNAALMKIDSETCSPIPVCDIELSGDTEELLSFKYDIRDALYTIYIDCKSKKNGYFTEILSFNNKLSVLERPQNKSGEYLYSETYRYEEILCDNYTGDSGIDIPAQRVYPDSFTEDGDSKINDSIYITSYLSFEKGSLHRTADYYLNSDCGFKIAIDSLRDTAYIVYSADTGSTQFRLRDSDSDDNLLFTVSSAENGNQSPGYFVRLTPLGESKGFTQSGINGLIEAY